MTSYRSSADLADPADPERSLALEVRQASDGVLEGRDDLRFGRVGIAPNPPISGTIARYLWSIGAGRVAPRLLDHAGSVHRSGCY